MQLSCSGPNLARWRLAVPFRKAHNLRFRQNASLDQAKLMTEHPLDRLFAQVALRRDADPHTSYTAKLLHEGVPKCAKKVGEEGVEVAIAATTADKRATIEESADLLYHLAVLWAAVGVDPGSVYAELAAREGRSGLDSKAARKGSAVKA